MMKRNNKSILYNTQDLSLKSRIRFIVYKIRLNKRYLQGWEDAIEEFNQVKTEKEYEKLININFDILRLIGAIRV